MIELYASWTGTKRNLSALRRQGWRLLMTPDTLTRCKGKTRPRWPDGDPAPYCLDNGAWGCHQRGEDFNADAFAWALERIGTGADWVVAPDIVGGGLESLKLTAAWLPRIDHHKVLIAVQDGMSPADVGPMLNSGRGIFLGGSTEYKLRSMPEWGRYARRRGVHFHVARVNTISRLRACQSAGVNSIDGSSATRFAVNAGILPSAMKQVQLWGRS
jgi:hypothetical protein